MVKRGVISGGGQTGTHRTRAWARARLITCSRSGPPPAWTVSDSDSQRQQWQATIATVTVTVTLHDSDIIQLLRVYILLNLHGIMCVAIYGIASCLSRVIRPLWVSQFLIWLLHGVGGLLKLFESSVICSIYMPIMLYFTELYFIEVLYYIVLYTYLSLFSLSRCFFLYLYSLFSLPFPVPHCPLTLFTFLFALSLLYLLTLISLLSTLLTLSPNPWSDAHTCQSEPWLSSDPGFLPFDRMRRQYLLYINIRRHAFVLYSFLPLGRSLPLISQRVEISHKALFTLSIAPTTHSIEYRELNISLLYIILTKYQHSSPFFSFVSCQM